VTADDAPQRRVQPERKGELRHWRDRGAPHLRGVRGGPPCPRPARG
jgi:hypothetical protein